MARVRSAMVADPLAVAMSAVITRGDDVLGALRAATTTVAPAARSRA